MQLSEPETTTSLWPTPAPLTFGEYPNLRPNSFRLIPNVNLPKPSSLSVCATRIGSSRAYLLASTFRARSYISMPSQPVQIPQFFRAPIAQNTFSPNQHSARTGDAYLVHESFEREGPKLRCNASRSCSALFEKETSILN